MVLSLCCEATHHGATERGQREATVDSTIGVLIAIVSSSLGGSAAAVTRYLVGNADPITLAILRWGIGFIFVLPAAFVMHAIFPSRDDWPAVAGLGALWIKSRHVQCKTSCPLYPWKRPKKRTSPDRANESVQSSSCNF